MTAYEIEIKSLLGTKDNAQRLIDKMKSVDADTMLVNHNKQLNHYFVGGDVENLYNDLKNLFGGEVQKKLKQMIKEGSDFSIRSREVGGVVKLVLKASIGDDTSANGVSRIEFEEEVRGMSFNELDQRVLDSGFSYQAKWSRERQEYVCKDINVCIDKNAGYGYLAEFERVIDDRSLSGVAQRELRDFMKLVECEELAQDRLERMFAFYNTHWSDYYGTEKVFVIN